MSQEADNARKINCFWDENRIDTFNGSGTWSSSWGSAEEFVRQFRCMAKYENATITCGLKMYERLVEIGFNVHKIRFIIKPLFSVEDQMRLHELNKLEEVA